MITNPQAANSPTLRAFKLTCNSDIFFRMASICARASTGGPGSVFCFRQRSFNSWSFMHGLLLHQDGKLFLRAMQGDAHVVRVQAERVRYFLIAEVFEEQDDQRFLRFVELGDGFIQTGQPPIIRSIRLLLRFNAPREIVGPARRCATVAPRMLPDKTD